MIKKTLTYLFLFLIIISISSCGLSKKSVNIEKLSKHFYALPSKTKNLNKDWVIILPGYSGIKVFKDTNHYFSVAKELNAAGFDVLVIDYKKASRKAGYRFPWEFANGTRWATEKAIEWGKANNYIQSENNGHIVSWSAGSEGTLLLLNDTLALDYHQIKSAAFYYPSNRDSTELNTNIPILVQTGDMDNVTPLENIKSTFAHQSNVEMIVYPNSLHGFDVMSIVEKRKLQIPPLLGKKFYFQYNEDACEKSREKLIDFLKQN